MAEAQTPIEKVRNMIATATTYTLFIWIAATAPAKLPFGPFDSAGQCEGVYSQVMSKYIGTEKIEHQCLPKKGDDRDGLDKTRSSSRS